MEAGKQESIAFIKAFSPSVLNIIYVKCHEVCPANETGIVGKYHPSVDIIGGSLLSFLMMFLFLNAVTVR